jgi:sRNA-binding protein
MTALDSGRTPGGKPGFRNHKNKAQSTTPPYKKVAQLRALLRERHAVIQNCLPLVIGIHEAILTAYPEQGKTAIRRALQFHTTSRAYLKNLTAGGHRYDLAGQPWGLITPEHQHYAQQQLTLKEQRDARRQAPKQTPRTGPGPSPRANSVSNTTRVETEDGAGSDAIALRLKETRTTLRLKRKERQP